MLAYFGGDTARGRGRYEEFVMEGACKGMLNPLERGKGHGIIGGREFIKRIGEKYIESRARSRELPAVRRIVLQVEPERIMGIVCDTFGECDEEEGIGVEIEGSTFISEDRKGEGGIAESSRIQI